jgi:photosystem II stability/assembly factor-like uncharacterized protein
MFSYSEKAEYIMTTNGFNFSVAARCAAALLLASVSLPTQSVLAADNPLSGWTKTSLDLFGTDIGVAIAPNGSLFASDGFGIYRSDNQGVKWSQVAASNNFAGGAISIDPSDPNTIIAGRSHGLLKSIDGGANWFQLVDLNAGSPANTITFDASKTSTVYAGVGYGWGLYKSLNGGATWTNPLPSRDVRAVAVDSSNSQVIYAGTHSYSSYKGGVLKSVNGGSTWSTVFQEQEITSLIMDPTNPLLIYVGTEQDGIFRSPDGGETWLSAGGTEITSPVSELVVDPLNSSHLFAGTSGQGVFYSPDSGLTWSAVNLGLTDYNIVALDIQDASPYRIIAATYGGSAFLSTVTVPEPGSLAFIGMGLLLVARRRGRRMGE